jgi:hypothetical protein
MKLFSVMLHLPAQTTYKVLDELADNYPMLLRLGKQKEPGGNQALMLG